MIPKTQQAVNRPYHLSNHTMKKIQIHLIPFLLAAALLLATMIFPWVKLAEGKSAISGEIFQSVLRVQTILESEDWKKAVLRDDSREAFTELSTKLTLLNSCYQNSSLTKRVNGSRLPELSEQAQRLILILEEKDAREEAAWKLLEALKPYFRAVVYREEGKPRDHTQLKEGTEALSKLSGQPELSELFRKISGLWSTEAPAGKTKNSALS